MGGNVPIWAFIEVKTRFPEYRDLVPNWNEWEFFAEVNLPTNRHLKWVMGSEILPKEYKPDGHAFLPRGFPEDMTLAVREKYDEKEYEYADKTGSNQWASWVTVEELRQIERWYIETFPDDLHVDLYVRGTLFRNTIIAMEALNANDENRSRLIFWLAY